MRILVAGIATPFGDDAAGRFVVERFAGLGVEGVETAVYTQPLDLVDALRDVDAAVLVDATRCGLAAGSIHEPRVADLCEARAVSSHGIGVREALALASEMGCTPERLAIVGIEARDCAGDGLSEPVRRALGEATERVRAHCLAWRALAHGARAALEPDDGASHRA